MLGMEAMRYRVLMEEAIISPTTVALWFVGCWCSEVVGAFGMLKPDVFSGARCGA